jgi:hypothetical protein
VIFQVYADGADPKRDRPVHEAGSQNEGGKAEAEWKPVETREAGDTSELKYFFTAAARRAKEARSGSITVKNPQILEMKWDPDFVYHGEKAKLTIHTFETADLAPNVTVRLYIIWEENKENFLLERGICLDRDEKTVEFELDFSYEAYRDTEIEYLDCKIDARVYGGEPEIKIKPPPAKAVLTIGADYVHE